MLIFFVFVKLLSLMNIERVGQSDSAERQAHRSGDPCSDFGSGERIRDFY